MLFRSCKQRRPTVENALVCRQRRKLARRIYLPPELVDHIFSYLCEDLPSLSHCSLVCWAWSIISSRYLFPKASIPLEPLEPSPTKPESYVSRMDRMLHRLSTSPRLSSVRDLCLRCARVLRTQNTCRLNLRYEPQISVVSLRGLLDSLPHLRNLEISHDYIQPASSPLSCLDGPRKLDKVVFICQGNAPFGPEPYIDILRLFESISEVEFHHLPDPGLKVDVSKSEEYSKAEDCSGSGEYSGSEDSESGERSAESGEYSELESIQNPRF